MSEWNPLKRKRGRAQLLSLSSVQTHIDEDRVENCGSSGIKSRRSSCSLQYTRARAKDRSELFSVSSIERPDNLGLCSSGRTRSSAAQPIRAQQRERIRALVARVAPAYCWRCKARESQRGRDSRPLERHRWHYTYWQDTRDRLPGPRPLPLSLPLYCACIRIHIRWVAGCTCV